MGGETANLPPTSVQTLEYYPFQVKGYQRSYPHDRILVLIPVDARDFKDTGGVSHEPLEGEPAVGVLLGRTGNIMQRLYSAPIDSTVQKAIARSAEEAGMAANTSGLKLQDALRQSRGDYVLASRITRCWVTKHQAPDARSGLGWHPAADFQLEVAIYKAPFGVPFWQGTSAATYNDPPVSRLSGNPEDDVEIYDQPGQVLSVALTRAVAGIFKRESLHSLMLENPMPRR